MRNTTRLRDYLRRERILVAPGAADALVAKIIEHVGFEAVYLTGAGVSYTTLARPDVGLLTMTEMVQRAAYVVEAVGIPVIADADTGYGGVLNVARSVREFERAGVAGLQIEDQVFPKKCGHLANKEVVSRQEMIARIKVAVDSRVDEDLVIIARTDARAVLGLEEAIERAVAYAEAGADAVFVEAPHTVDEMREIVSALDVPAVANMVEGGRSPLLSARELEAIGYKIVLFPNSAVRMSAAAVCRLMKSLRETGTTVELVGEMLSFKQLNDFLGLHPSIAMEERYASRE